MTGPSQWPRFRLRVDGTGSSAGGRGFLGSSHNEHVDCAPPMKPLCVLFNTVSRGLPPRPPQAIPAPTERWPSGRRRTPGKCVGGEPSRGFESLSLRHLPSRKRSPDPAAAGFFRCFRGLCGMGCEPAPAPGGSEAVSKGRYSPDLLTVTASVSRPKARI